MTNSINTGMTFPKRRPDWQFVGYVAFLFLLASVAVFVAWRAAPQQASAADRSATALEKIAVSLEKMEPKEPVKKPGKAK